LLHHFSLFFSLLEAPIFLVSFAVGVG